MEQHDSHGGGVGRPPQVVPDGHGDTLEALKGMAESYKGEAIYPFASHVVAVLEEQNRELDQAAARLEELAKEVAELSRHERLT